MLFFVSVTESTAGILMTEKDLDVIKTGRTLFIDSRHMQGQSVNKVVICYSATDKSAEELLLKYAGAAVPEKITPDMIQPTAGVKKCNRCGGENPEWSLDDSHCIVCWKQRALSAEFIADKVDPDAQRYRKAIVENMKAAGIMAADAEPTGPECELILQDAAKLIRERVSKGA